MKLFWCVGKFPSRSDGGVSNGGSYDVMLVLVMVLVMVVVVVM
jgi:hypothetical protein